MRSGRILATAAGLLSAALGICAPVAAQDEVKWRQSPIIFLPSEVRSGQQMLNEGDLIVSFPLRWIFSTRLSQDVTLDHDGESGLYFRAS